MRLKAQWLVITVCALTLCGLPACNRDRDVHAAGETQPDGTPAEQDFMMKASQANLAEIDMARIALEKTDNSDVRDYANMIQSDHTSALKDLADLMKDKNVSQPRTLAPETQQDISRMSNLTGPEFDREFMNMMVSDHQKAVEMFRDQQTIAQNADVKDYVEDLLPKLEMHLDKAQRLQSKLFSSPAKPARRTEPTVK
jgi:putative membrane protein